MAGSGERAVVGRGGGKLELGDLVTFQARHLGIRWTLAARVCEYHRPEDFTDKQVRGPFKRWHHVHHFTSDGGGGTVMRDVIDFAAPLGPLGALVDRLVLHRYMINLIERRNQYIKALLESP